MPDPGRPLIVGRDGGRRRRAVEVPTLAVGLDVGIRRRRQERAADQGEGRGGAVLCILREGHRLHPERIVSRHAARPIRQAHRRVERDVVGQAPELAVGPEPARDRHGGLDAIPTGPRRLEVGPGRHVLAVAGVLGVLDADSRGLGRRIHRGRLGGAVRHVVADAGLLAVDVDRAEDALVVELDRRPDDVAAFLQIGHHGRLGIALADAQLAIGVAPEVDAAHPAHALDKAAHGLAWVHGEVGERLREDRRRIDDAERRAVRLKRATRGLLQRVAVEVAGLDRHGRLYQDGGFGPPPIMTS